MLSALQSLCAVSRVGQSLYLLLRIERVLPSPKILFNVPLFTEMSDVASTFVSDP